jgi:2-methylcitrate dehydratase PrpD
MISTKAQDAVRTTTLVSVARQLALLAHDPARLYDVDRSAPVTNEAIRSFEAKVTIVAELSLAQHYPSQWPAEVEVSGTDGSTRSERVIAALGDPGRPLGDTALDDKAHRLLDHLIGRARADELIGIARRGLVDAAACRALAGTFVQCFPIIA